MSRPPKTALERSYLTDNSSSENRILRPRRKKLLTEFSKKRMTRHIFIMKFGIGFTQETAEVTSPLLVYIGLLALLNLLHVYTLCCVVTVFTLYRILNRKSRSTALPYPEHGCRRSANHAEPLYILRSISSKYIYSSHILSSHFSFSFSLNRRHSDPRSLSRLFSPLLTTERAFFFIARRLSAFLPRRLASNCASSRYKALSAVGVSTNLKQKSPHRDLNPRLQP